MTLKVKTGKSGCGRAACVLSVAIVAAVATGALAYAPAPVVFDTPAADEKGIMVLGNQIFQKSRPAASLRLAARRDFEISDSPLAHLHQWWGFCYTYHCDASNSFSDLRLSFRSCGLNRKRHESGVRELSIQFL